MMQDSQIIMSVIFQCVGKITVVGIVPPVPTVDISNSPNCIPAL